jgi:PKHD-type hydroxylase
MELLHPWLYKCQLVNRNYYSYDINWDFHIEVLCYNLYGIGGKYEWHIDSNSTEGPSPKLTCLLNLSEEPYEGGDLHIVGKNEKQKFNSSGSSIVFTSLLSHKVTPVTKGERITLTYWGEGPAWR